MRGRAADNGSFPPIAATASEHHDASMIDFERVWLPQIVSYAKHIIAGRLEDQWFGRVGTVTSVTSPNELFEQVFGDLDAEHIWTENRSTSNLSDPAKEAIGQFLAGLHELDGDALAVVRSAAWTRIKEAAQAVVASVP